jgi:hypothetical protein
MAFAEKTRVPITQTRSEIEKLLLKHGAAGFSYGWTPDLDKIEFAWRGRHVRFVLPRPKKNQNPVAQHELEQLDRQRWRALLLVVKAKLEAVEMGIAVFEEEFLAFIVMQDDRTIGQHLVPRLNAGTLGVKLLSEGEK